MVAEHESLRISSTNNFISVIAKESLEDACERTLWVFMGTPSVKDSIRKSAVIFMYVYIYTMYTHIYTIYIFFNVRGKYQKISMAAHKYSMGSKICTKSL